jgi:hypothetical protein
MREFDSKTALVAVDFVPETYPLEFHYYSAEEGGLLGSQAIARAYKQDGKAGRAMLQVGSHAISFRLTRRETQGSL